VFRLDPNDRNLASLHELFTGMNREPLIAQKFLPDVSAGDKRIILVDGEPVGAINRVPAPGETRSNMHVGGRPEKTVLTAREREICAAIGPRLREMGQVFVGIDVIGGYLTEINVTSPTGIQELERFDGVNVAGRIWDAIDLRLGRRLKLRRADQAVAERLGDMGRGDRLDMVEIGDGAGEPQDPVIARARSGGSVRRRSGAWPFPASSGVAIWSRSAPSASALTRASTPSSAKRSACRMRAQGHPTRDDGGGFAARRASRGRGRRRAAPPAAGRSDPSTALRCVARYSCPQTGARPQA
jgi:hypothetical protein